MRSSLVIRALIGLPGLLLFLFTAPIAAQEDFPESFKWWRNKVEDVGGDLLQTTVLLLGLVVLVIAVFWDRLIPGPRLVSGEFVELQRDAVGGSDLQLVGVEIYNKRESGGERRTARGVVPEMEAFNAEGDLVDRCQGVWFQDVFGNQPTAVDFRPTRERHPLELVAKFPAAADAWLAGQRNPRLTPGVYKIRATFRGGGVRRPRRLEWFVWNPGSGDKLMPANEKDDLPALPERSEASGDAGAELEPISATAQSEVEQPAEDEEPNERIERLLAEADELEEKLWERNKAMRRSGRPLPSLGQDYIAEVRAWNREVLDVADTYLNAKEASYVPALVGVAALWPGPQLIEELLNDCRQALRRAQSRIDVAGPS